MKFVATLTHPPEKCFAEKGYRKDYEKWLRSLRTSAKKLGVRIDGAYIAPSEHTFYFVLDSNSMDGVSKLLGPPMLTHSSGRLSPVITLDEGNGLLKEFSKEGR